MGSHDHGEAAGHIFSLVISARLHRLDPESYLRDPFRVLAHEMSFVQALGNERVEQRQRLCPLVAARGTL